MVFNCSQKVMQLIFIYTRTTSIRCAFVWGIISSFGDVDGSRVTNDVGTVPVLFYFNSRYSISSSNVKMQYMPYIYMKGRHSALDTTAGDHDVMDTRHHQHSFVGPLAREGTSADSFWLLLLTGRLFWATYIRGVFVTTEYESSRKEV